MRILWCHLKRTSPILLFGVVFWTIFPQVFPSWFFEMLAIHVGSAYMSLSLLYVFKMYIFVLVENGLRSLISGKRNNFSPFALVITFFTRVDNERFLSILTHRYFTFLDHLIRVSPNFIFLSIYY